MNPPELPPRRPPPPDVAEIDRLRRDTARLAAVRASGLLESPAEEAFDSLTRLAARLLKVPASFVSVVDRGRDFYKSQTGFPAPLSVERQAEGRTFCHFTLDSDEMLVIDDTHADPVWRAVPTVGTLGVRAYVGVPLKLDGQTVGSFCVIDTQPRQWHSEELETLRQLAMSAGRELGLRSALAAASSDSQRSRALARSREEVVAVVAHDLRTPLQILQLSATLLRRDASPAQEGVFVRMDKAMDAMKSLAETLLSSNALLAPLAAGRAPLDARAVAHDAVDMMAPIAQRAGIHLVLGEAQDAIITIDYSLMLRILGNLIGNAIKFSHAGGSVTVSARRDGETLVLAVSDDGIGMTPDDQTHAFDSGWQGAPGMVRGDGAGLGLSIVRRLVEEHGGRVEIASEFGTGSKLTVILPCA